MFPDPEALLDKTLGGYHLRRVVGAGGAGTVYAADAPSGEAVAVKVLLPAIRVSPEEMAAIRQRFQREAEVLARLRHPHILPLLAFDTDPATGYFFMVTPLLTGGTLADRLNRGALPFAQVSAYITQIADALDYAHAQNVIHRDIKPSNVLLDEHDQAVLADFGIAKMIDTFGFTITATGAILGTPEYMSIEQLQGNNDAITAATDVYGLGALAYHLLTDKKPYVAATPQAVILAVAQSAPIPPRVLRPELPQAAEAVILKALARLPSQRFPTTGAFAAALATGLQGIWPAGVERPLTQPPTVAATVPVTITPPEKSLHPQVPPSGNVVAQPPYPVGGYSPYQPQPIYQPQPMPYQQAGAIPAPPATSPRRSAAPWLIGVAGIVIVAILALLLHGIVLNQSSGSTTAQHGTHPMATSTPGAGTTNRFTYAYKAPTQTGGSIALGINGALNTLNTINVGTSADIDLADALWGACAIQLPDLALGSKGWVPDQCTQVPTTTNGGESTDGMTTTLHIDPKSVWSDGQPITSNDYLLSYQIYKNVLGNVAPYSLIKTVTAPDVATVQIIWQMPYAPYLTALWEPLPEHSFGAFTTGTYSSTFLASQAFNFAFTVDSGPYTVAQFAVDSTSGQGQSVTLKANKRYHSNFFHGPFLDQIAVTMSNSPSTLIADFKAGQFAHVEGFSAIDAANFAGIPQNEQVVSPENGFQQVMFNLRDAAPSAAFSNDGHSIFNGTQGKLVRKAFIEAFDLCGAYIALFQDTNCHDPNLYTAEDVVAPDPAYDTSVTLPSFNVAQAKADLTAAGYPGGKNKNGTPLQVMIVFSSSRVLNGSFATLLQQEWNKNLGVSVNLSSHAFGILGGTSGVLTTGTFDVSIIGDLNTGDDDGITPLIESDEIPGSVHSVNSGYDNFIGLHDPKIDTYLAKGRATLDDAQRKQNYHDLFAYLASLDVFEPLFITADYSLTKPTLGNYLQHPLAQGEYGVGNTWNIADWWTAGVG